jgi:hypothetical protein
MSYEFDRGEVFGPPPPMYPCTIMAVRVDGDPAVGDAAKVTPDRISFDIEIETVNGPRQYLAVKSAFPAADPTLDINGPALIGKSAVVWYFPTRQRLVLYAFLPPDSIECAKL